MPAAGPHGPRSNSRRAWGWHPLVDHWAARIVAEAGIRPGDLVVDLGAGTGSLTRHLLLAGARVIAVELHAGRAAALRSRCPEATVVEADLRDFRWPHRPFTVVANPPYALSSALVRVLLSRDSRLLAADLVLQRAAVRRFAGASGPTPVGRSGAPGGTANRWLLRSGLTLPRHAFSPAPQVDSTVLVIRRR